MVVKYDCALNLHGNASCFMWLLVYQSLLSHHIKYNLLHNLQRWGWVQSILYLSKEILTLLQQKLLPCVDFVPLDSCGTATVQSHREQRGVVCTNSAHAWSWWQSPWSRTLWDHSNTMATVLNTSCGTQNIVITKHRHWILAIWRLRHWYASKYWLQQPIYTKFQIIDYRFRVLPVFFNIKCIIGTWFGSIRYRCQQWSLFWDVCMLRYQISLLVRLWYALWQLFYFRTCLVG